MTIVKYRHKSLSRLHILSILYQRLVVVKIVGPPPLRQVDQLLSAQLGLVFINFVNDLFHLRN